MCSKHIDFSEPLELTLPEIFGDLDDQQLFLIRHGRKDVVLKENASAIIAAMKDHFGFLEMVIDNVIKGCDKIKSMGSVTFPCVLKNNVAPIKRCVHTSSFKGVDYTSYEVAKTTEEIGTFIFSDIVHIVTPIKKARMQYSTLIRKLRKEYAGEKRVRFTRATEYTTIDTFVLHVALDECGHYGIIIYSEKDKECVIFDSMATRAYGGWSSYTLYLMQIACDIFEVRIVTIPCLPFDAQITGGFVTSSPSSPTYLDDISSLDSQNHFCYFWAVWFLDHFIHHTPIHPLNPHEHPLDIIKGYIVDTLNATFTTDAQFSNYLKGVFQISPFITRDLVTFFRRGFAPARRIA